MQEITFDELSTLKQPSASLRTALDKISAALGSVGDAGQQARSVVDELRVSLRAAAAQSVKSARSLAKFDEINRLPAPAAQKAAAPEKEKRTAGNAGGTARRTAKGSDGRDWADGWRAVLDSLRHSGLSLIVDCDDFNCDTALLEAAYSLPAGAVKVLNTAEHELMNPATAWLPESDGNMLHLGSFASFVGGLEAAAGAAEGERKSAVVVTASVLISCVLGVLLTLTGGLATLPLPALVLYQAAWCVLAMIFPLFQRY